MITRKTIRIIGYSTLGIFLFLGVILIVHIAMAKPVQYDNASMQISRIDFKESLDSLKMKEIHRTLKTIPGFINDSYDLQRGILVYFHNNKIADSETIFNQLISKGHYKAERFIVPAELQNKQVCPVMKEDSFGANITKCIQYAF